MMSMNPFLWLILTIINIYFWIILAMVVLSWLVAFNVVNRSNPYVRQIGYALERLTEPLLRPIRRFLPDLGGIDLSPIVLLIAMQFFGMLVTGSSSGSASRDIAAPGGQGRTAPVRPRHAQRGTR
jgi:YggT family protein